MSAILLIWGLKLDSMRKKFLFCIICEVFMAYSHKFWDGVDKIGGGLGGLAGAYTLAVSWGSTATVGGLVGGAAGILVGAFAGAFVGALALTFAVWAVSAVIGTLFNLTKDVAEGTRMALDI